MAKSKIIFCAAVLAAAASAARSAPAPEVRVGVIVSARTVEINPGDYRLSDGSGLSTRLRSQGKIKTEAVPEGIRIGRRLLKSPVAFQPWGDGFAGINGRPYRGRLEIHRTSGGLTLVNVLSVEDYVAAILIHEASPGWPAEALRAQAVISRTYALKNRGRHKAQGFDVCDEVHCQVYGAKSSERDTTNRAVQDTRGEVVLHRGRVAGTFFHSNCGGATEDADAAWEGGPVPYLKSVRCSWCKGNPRYAWEAEVKMESAERALRAAGVDVGKLEAFKVLEKSRSGRAALVRVTGSKRSVDLPGNRFRLILNPGVVRSTYWTTAVQRHGVWHFAGRGWGHGVGLCQWGMKAMADAGWDYRKILSFYYQDVSVGSVRA
ncbi:MAG: SpoIID/LytB domain-containing protein [Elusimicrobiota bacterium]